MIDYVVSHFAELVVVAGLLLVAFGMWRMQHQNRESVDGGQS